MATDCPPLLGTLDLVVTSRGVARVAPGRGRVKTIGPEALPMAARVERELAEYCEGRRAYFSIPTDLADATPFQQAVFDATQHIPYGTTRTFREIAETIRRPGTTRAVGAVLAKNPVAIIVPCHRVVRSDGAPLPYVLGARVLRHLRALERETAAWVGVTKSRVVCRLGCPDEQRAPGKERTEFPSLAAAEASGYRPCPRCQSVEGTIVKRPPRPR